MTGYADLGRVLDQPVSGLITGRWLAHCPEELPWWRVVGAKGDLLIAKRSPEMAKLQRERLLSEGVEFVGERVDMIRFWTDPHLSEL